MLEQYDKAWLKYRQSMMGKPLPLLSWGQFSIATYESSAFDSLQKKWSVKEDLNSIVNERKLEVVVTNPRLEIVFASRDIYKMNGYYPNELLGNSPRMLQGELTSEEVKKRIKIAISQKQPFKEVILNYKKDGSNYLCEIEAVPKFDKNGELLNYIAFERIAS
jgi:PAS domain S-box-containing protein